MLTWLVDEAGEMISTLAGLAYMWGVRYFFAETMKKEV